MEDGLEKVFTRNDMDFILKEFVIPREDTRVCDLLDGYEKDESGESWCARKCKWYYPADKCYYKLLEKAGKNRRMVEKNYYDIYDAVSDDYITGGTADACAKFLNVTKNEFYKMYSGYMTEEQSKYKIIKQEKEKR